MGGRFRDGERSALAPSFPPKKNDLPATLLFSPKPDAVRSAATDSADRYA